MLGQVLKDSCHDGTVFLEQSYGPVAVAAQQSPDALAAACLSRAASMVVVYGQPLPERIPLRANSADIALTGQHGVVRLDGDAVVMQKSPAESALLCAREPVPVGGVAPDALTRPVGGTLTASAPDPLIFGPRTVARSHCHARAQQRVPHLHLIHAQLQSKRLERCPVDIETRDVRVLLQRESRFTSHALMIQGDG